MGLVNAQMQLVLFLEHLLMAGFPDPSFTSTEAPSSLWLVSSFRRRRRRMYYPLDRFKGILDQNLREAIMKDFSQTESISLISLLNSS